MDFDQSFQIFQSYFFLRLRNATSNALENEISRMSPLKNGFSIEIVYKPFVLENVTNLCVFNHDQQILDFMASDKVFRYVSIEEDDHNQDP